MEKLGRSIPVTRPYKLPLESNKWGGAYFDGVSGYIDTVNPPINANFNTKLTCIGTVIPLGTPTGGSDAGFGQRGWNKWLYFHGSSPTIMFNVQTDAGGNMAFGSTIAKLRKLYHLVGTFEQSGADMLGKLYIDGKLDSTQTVLNNTPHDTSNQFMRAGSLIHNNGAFVQMILCDFIMIAQVLTQPQIQDLMYGRILPTQFDCRLWHDYRLGHARDLSGNGNHGVINGNVRFV